MPIQNAARESQLPELPESHAGKVWLFGALAFVLACASLGTFVYAQHQRKQMDDLAVTNQTLNASLTQLQEQLQSVTERLTRRIEESTPAAAPASAPHAVTRKPAAPKPP